jgi:RNA polymerase sigma-54 factor
MHQGLQLKFSSQLTMTPQLQQAIRLLQLSTLDLQQEIIEQLYNNPLLETDEESASAATSESQQAVTDHSAEDINLNSDSPLVQDRARDASEPTVTESEDHWQAGMDEKMPVESDWNTISSTSTSSSKASGEVNLEEIYQVTQTLQDHLIWQLNLTPFSARDRAIAEAFIDDISDAGFISEDLGDITSHLSNHSQTEAIEEDELLAVLKRLQQFDPPGIFARDLRECLLIQLHQLDSITPHREEAVALVRDFLDDIASVEFNKLARKSKLDPNDLRQALNLIKSLNPQPGEHLCSNNAEYIVPDVHVEKVSGTWQVRLNNDNLPRLKINQSYASLIKRSDDSTENQYLKNNLVEARWFLRSLESRNDSLMRVATAIVEMQQGFLNHGPVAMRPMVLSDIAQQLDLHESTVSRVTTKKYMATPQGIFELKYFFSSHVGTTAGGECSSTAVCAMLKEMISAEQPSKPLSDNKLAALLAEQGIQVARRTVAKYRESINIPSSSQRKRFSSQP